MLAFLNLYNNLYFITNDNIQMKQNIYEKAFCIEKKWKKNRHQYLYVSKLY